MVSSMTDSTSARAWTPSDIKRTDADEVQAMVSAANMAQIRLLINTDQRSDEWCQMPKVQK